MVRFVLFIVLACLAGLPAAAQQRLQTLDTGFSAHGLEGVGRLELAGKGFCTGSLIAEDLVLTAAHCLFDKTTGQRIPDGEIFFRAGYRNGSAKAIGQVHQAVVHPEYRFRADQGPERVTHDLALLRLRRSMGRVVKAFPIGGTMNRRAKVAIVSYAHDRADAPSLERSCNVLGRQDSVYVMGCDVDYGSSGAPVFSMVSGQATIVSVVSAKAQLEGDTVALGPMLSGNDINRLQQEFARSGNRPRGAGGAKFVKVGGG